MEIPQALFSCSTPGCREECSYPADMLYWYEPERRWMCEPCWDNLLTEEAPQTKVSLKTYLLMRGLCAPSLLAPPAGR